MYTGYGFRDFEIGDVDVVRHDGLYHLFHLILPNHDYIAHAVSEDGLGWRRVRNALFIGDPEAWDDDMLWTMHVSPDPHRSDGWRMFYTGLCMRDRGRVQRIGLARSDDLYDWTKDDSGRYPLEASSDHYEHGLDEGRGWVSFRDPYCFLEDGDACLLASARVNHGPLIRRGCVALATEVGKDRFELQPPVHHPRQYDDLEVPSVVKLEGRYYLIASIREDVKVHYWVADELRGPYRNYHDNVLLPQGNYAARVSRTGDRHLVWNFFFQGLTTEGPHLMAPPKELAVDESGELRLRSFDGFDALGREVIGASDRPELRSLFDNPHASGRTAVGACRFGCDYGFEAFLLPGEHQDFILTGDFRLEGSGKCGLVLRVDENGDGYYLSLDLFKGIAQIRAWGRNPAGGIEEAFLYEQLQAAHYVPDPAIHSFRLVAYQQYLEFSLDGDVLLTLADDRYGRGGVGFYVESAKMQVERLRLRACELSGKPSYPTGVANF